MGHGSHSAGCLMTLATLGFVECLKQEAQKSDEQKKVLARADAVAAQLQSALVLLPRARTAYLAHRDAPFVQAYLNEAKAVLTEASRLMHSWDMPSPAVGSDRLEGSSARPPIDWYACEGRLRAY